MHADRRGTMPFAIIAVTILLVSAAAVGVTASQQRANDNADGTSAEISAVDEALEDMTSYIDRGLGQLIYEISTDPSLGGLESRERKFQERAAHWIDLQFPMISGGVRAECTGFSLNLTSVAMGFNEDGNLDGYLPTYLKGAGTVSVKLHSQSGRSDADLAISTDGSYALSLSVERGTLFENMAGENGISLAQMMSYQLTCLAEYRIMNGYGGYAYGPHGTDSIITREDVAEAYEICLEAIAAVCFRDADNQYSWKDGADLADALVARDGRIEVDLSAVYAQALISVADDVLLRFIDYLYGFKILDFVQDRLLDFYEALNCLWCFFTGGDAFSAVPYLESTMREFGYSEDDYRHPGQGTVSVTLGDYELEVNCPTLDLFEQKWIKNFKSKYDHENTVEKYILDALRAAAARVAAGSSLGVVTVEVDAFDERGFAEVLCELIESAMSDGVEAMESAVTQEIANGRTNDPFYGSLADEILGHAEDFVLESKFKSAMGMALENAVKKDASATGADFVMPDIDGLLHSEAAGAAVAEYRAKVYRDLYVFEELRTVEGEEPIFKKALVEICSLGLNLLDILAPMEDRAALMVSEIAGIVGTNPYGGATDMPGHPGFDVQDDAGNVFTERLSVDVATSNTAISVQVDEGRCVHTVGFRDELSAAYSTMFVVQVRGWVDYEVTGTSALADAMGTVSSCYRGGFAVDATVEVAAASGWALAGVSYSPSTTILNDLWELLCKIFEPIIEPLRELLGMIRSAATALSEALMSCIGFISEVVVKLYLAVMEPLEILKEMLESALESFICNALFGILVNINLGEQSLRIEFFGCALTITTSMVTWVKNTKTLVSVDLMIPIAGIEITAGVNVKVRGEMAAKNLLLTFYGGIAGKSWEVSAKVDPLLKSSKYLFSVDGKIGGTSFSIVAPKLEDYYEMGVSLSDVPGVGRILNNIPIPVLGMNIGLDAGFSLRYSTPVLHSLIINEFESNPKGTDSKNEWVEILNNGDTTVELDGYELVAASDKKTKRMTLEGTIYPGEYLVVYPTFTLVNTSGKDTKSGEGLKLYDPEGNLVDETPIKADSSDDANTWQRKYDGSTEWVFAKGTPGKSNAGSWIGAIITPSEMLHCVWEGVEKAFGKIGSITDIPSLVQFVEYLIRYTIEEVIGVVSAQIIDASIYASIDVKAGGGVVTGGFRVALRTDGDLVKDVLKYLSGQLYVILMGMSNPYKIDPLGMFTENIDLEVSAHVGIGLPKFLNKTDESIGIDIALVFRTNLSSITRVIGKDTGSPQMVFGMMIRDCPKVVIPSKLGAKDGMHHDLWLLKMSIAMKRRRRMPFYPRGRWGRAWPRWTTGSPPSSPRTSSWRRRSTAPPRSASRGPTPWTAARRPPWRRSPRPGT